LPLAVLDCILANVGSIYNRDMRVDGLEPVAVEDLTDCLRELEGEVVELCGCHSGTECAKTEKTIGETRGL
jgi:hypothetical protein